MASEFTGRGAFARARAYRAKIARESGARVILTWHVSRNAYVVTVE